jgi:hypothetical protein
VEATKQLNMENREVLVSIFVKDVAVTFPSTANNYHYFGLNISMALGLED